MSHFTDFKELLVNNKLLFKLNFNNKITKLLEEFVSSEEYVGSQYNDLSLKLNKTNLLSKDSSKYYFLCIMNGLLSEKEIDEGPFIQNVRDKVRAPTAGAIFFKNDSTREGIHLFLDNDCGMNDDYKTVRNAFENDDDFNTNLKIEIQKFFFIYLSEHILTLYENAFFNFFDISTILNVIKKFDKQVFETKIAKVKSYYRSYLKILDDLIVIWKKKKFFENLSNLNYDDTTVEYFLNFIFDNILLIDELKLKDIFRLKIFTSANVEEFSKELKNVLPNIEIKEKDFNGFTVYFCTTTNTELQIMVTKEQFLDHQQYETKRLAELTNRIKDNLKLMVFKDFIIKLIEISINQILG